MFHNDGGWFKFYNDKTILSNIDDSGLSWSKTSFNNMIGAGVLQNNILLACYPKNITVIKWYQADCYKTVMNFTTQILEPFSREVGFITGPINENNLVICTCSIGKFTIENTYIPQYDQIIVQQNELNKLHGVTIIFENNGQSIFKYNIKDNVE